MTHWVIKKKQSRCKCNASANSSSTVAQWKDRVESTCKVNKGSDADCLNPVGT